ncbi:hypothetical protein BDR07DRAFT_1379612 [Suillus spraguei]|nr:hypothetical protein BDR07DRAFT_1379612 [Suillus spraguei]
MPSNLQVKNSIKVIFKDLNPLKGFAVRSRRPARNVSDMAQTFLPLIQGVASAIPIAGPPTQAVISGLLSILQLIDRRSQNKADLACLASRLRQLSLHLYNAPITQDPLEQGRRDSIFKILQETFEELTKLQNCRPESASITQAIARCSNQIDRYLVDCLVVFYCLKIFGVYSPFHFTHEALAILLRKQQDSVGPQLTAAVALDCVTLMDATGHEHRISVTFCTSFQQLNVTLQALFTRDSIEARLQRRYMEQGQYDLCIDDDKQVTRLTNHEWPGIEAGTTIVMRVVFEEAKADFGVKRKCHFCGAVNHIDNKYSLQRHAGSSIDW